MGNLHFDGQKLAGIGLGFDVHRCILIKNPVADINRIFDFDAANRVVLSLQNNIKQADECRFGFLGITSVDTMKDIVVIKGACACGRYRYRVLRFLRCLLDFSQYGIKCK